MKPLVLSLCLLVLPSASHAQDVGSAAPDFSATTTDGRTVTLSEYEGDVVLLDFWASWCVPCLKEMPFLVELAQEHAGDDFTVLAVNIDRKRASMDAFLKRLDVDVPFALVVDPELKLPPLYDPPGMPTSFLIDREGTIRFRHVGFRDGDRDQFRDELSQLLAE